MKKKKIRYERNRKTIIRDMQRRTKKNRGKEKKKRKERRRNMGNCLAPFQLTGQSNLFHVMALFTCLTKLRARHPS